MSEQKQPPLGVGIIGVVLISGVVAWWMKKDDPAPPPPSPPVVSGFVVTETAKGDRDRDRRDYEGWTSDLIDAAIERNLKKAGTDFDELKSWVARVRKIMDGFKEPQKSTRVSDEAIVVPVPDPVSKEKTSAASVKYGRYDYDSTLQIAKADNAPLLVLIGAEWCPYCKLVYRRIDGMKASKALSTAFAYIDEDKQPSLAVRLKRGNGLPQLFYWRSANDTRAASWRMGDTSEQQILAMVRG